MSTPLIRCVCEFLEEFVFIIHRIYPNFGLRISNQTIIRNTCEYSIH